MQRLDDRPSPLALEQWLLDEQTPAARARTEVQLDPAQRAALRDDDAALRAQLLETLPPAAFAASVHAEVRRAVGESKRSAPRVPARATWALAALATSMCALLLVLRTSTPPEVEPARELSERAKGAELALSVYRSRAGTVELLADGATARAHDVLQLGYRRAGHRFGVLLSIDGRGEVTLHYPSDPSGSTALPAEGGEVLLPEAYELDDAPAFERFVLVAADRPLVVSEVLAAARALALESAHGRAGSLLLSVPTSQRSLLVVKPPRP